MENKNMYKEGENKRLFGKLCYLHRQMCRENNQLFTEYGVTPVQMHALIFIHKSVKAGQRVCQKDVEKQINLRPSSVSTLISNLEKYVCIKDKLFMDSCDSAIQNALTEDEQEVFEKLLQKIINKITV